MKDVFKHYHIGHFINQPTNPTEFEVLRFDKMVEPNVDDFHKHSFYEILWTEKGKSRQIIDYNEYEVKPNSLFFISPNQVHRFEEWKPLSGGTILFTEDFYLLNRTNKDALFELSFLDNLYANPCIEFTKKAFAEILNLIHQIEAEQNRKDKNPTIIQAYLHILLAQVQRHIDKQRETAVSKKYLIQFKQFKTVLEQHFAENKTAKFYADKLHITQHHLNLICKETTNNTATETLRARSILEAKRLLTFTSKTISEIAFELNFTDSSYFAKTFKAFTKQTPQDFKTKMSEKYRTR
ncbi:AraC family transcriptional regulator [Arenibacter troitsensis]|uniref:AraC-type DNA-binding protein n=1 Tax=Arenibacter troitsensis TaxID=188872 RepID=A0A1X7LJK7_9FLAO|nr:AraC family transcriptional regulator [Arenibacter troitsensis]SMG53674.1 AraC-type DNA-binding protein [Arenibacter troitsensis]